MKKEALSLFGHSDWVLLGFLLFFFTFVGVLIWVTRESQKGHYKKMAMMPLEIDQKEVLCE